jgi:hypothetical protein
MSFRWVGREALRVVRSGIVQNRWTVLLGLPFILSSYFLPIPQLPDMVVGYKDLLVVAVESLWVVGGIALLRRRRVPLHRLGGVLVVAAACRWFFLAFTRWKAFMPQWAPFTWDERLLSAGAWLHGGQPLAIRLLPVLGSPSALTMLDRFYDTAFAAMAIVILWQAWSDDRARARRFMLAFVLVWVVMGVVVAGAFSSVGPVMLERLTGDPTFRPLLDAMHRAGRDGTLDAATSLWSWWAAVGASCISAFPSIHVAMPALYACVARGWLRVAFIVYTLITLVGSFMLAWHYALDGYAGILGAIACWWLAGRLLRPKDGRNRETAAQPSRAVESEQTETLVAAGLVK